MPLDFVMQLPKKITRRIKYQSMEKMIKEGREVIDQAWRERKREMAKAGKLATEEDMKQFKSEFITD